MSYRFLVIGLCLVLTLVGCGDDTASEDDAQVGVEQSTNAKTTQPAKVSKPDKLTPFKVLSVYQGSYDNAPAIQVNFSRPIKRNQDLAQLIQIYIKHNRQEGGWVISDDNRRIYYPYIEPEVTYSIRFSNQLLADNGTALSQEIKKEVKTRALKQQVRFLSQGSTILRDSGVLPVEAVNVDAVDVKFWRLDSAHYDSFFSNTSYRRYYQLQNLKEMAELVHTGRFELEAKDNQRLTHQIQLKDIKALKENGVYAVTMQPADDYPYQYEFSWFVISDIGLHTRQYQDTFVAFAHQLPSTEPYNNVELALLDKKGERIKSAKTDKDGFAQFNASLLNRARFLVASQGSNTNLIRLQSPKLDLSEFKLTKRQQYPLELFLYGPRDLYRPGEMVRIQGILRDSQANWLEPTPVSVRILRPDNKVYKTLQWQGDELGYYQTDFKLPDDAMRGQWIFEATLGNKTDFKYELAVEDFLPERLKLELRSNKKQSLGVKDEPLIDIQSDYLYGAPAGGNRFDGTLTVSSAKNPFGDYEGFYFGSNKYRDFDQVIDIPAGTLDDKGHTKLTLKNQWAGSRFPVRLLSSINVYESGGRPITRRLTQYAFPHDELVGVRPLWISEREFAAPNEHNAVELVAVNSQGSALSSGQEYEATLVREDSRRYWQYGRSGWEYRTSAANVPVYTKTVKFDSSERQQLSLPLEYGNYRLEVRNKNNQLLTSYHFFAGWYWTANTQQSGERPDQVQLSIEQDFVQLGEDLEVSIKAPYAGQALVTIESDELLWRKAVKLDAAESSVTIPVSKQWDTHNLYVSAMVLKPGDVERKHLPNRAFGVLHLPLDRQARELELSVNHDKKLRPQQTVDVEIEASNKQNDETVYTTLALVDSGILSISDFESPKPLDWFYGQRAYEAALKDNYGSLVELVDGKFARQRFGGDADLSRGGDAPVSDVQIVSIVKDKVELDENGKAKLSVELPYFNGELRLMAVAFSKKRYGSAESKAKVAAPLVVQASMPRFLAKGDQSEILLDVKNMEETEQTFTVSLAADDALGGTSVAKTLTLEPKAKALVPLRVTASRFTGAGTVSLTVESDNDELNMNRSWSLGLRPAYAASVISKQAAVKPGSQFSVDKAFARRYDSFGLKSVLSASTTPPLDAGAYIDGLLHYPYGCLEQTTSRAWPWLSVEQGDLSSLESKKVKELFGRRQELVDSAISRVISMQRYDGSFGLWSNDSPEEPWLTAYVTDFLLAAKQLGYQVPENNLNRAVKRLQRYVRSSAFRTKNWSYYDDREHFELAYRSYSAYVLSKIGRAKLQDVRALFDDKASDAERSLPLAHLAFALEKMGDQRRAKLAWGKAFTSKFSYKPYWYYGDYGSPIRDMSQVASLSLESKVVDNLDVDGLDLVFDLKGELQTRRWLSTQEKGALARLAKQLSDVSVEGAELSLSIQQANEEQSFKQTSDYVGVEKGNPVQQPLTLSNKGDKTVFVDYKVQGYPKAAPDGLFKDIAIKRRYFNLQGEPIAIKDIAAGDRVIVGITVELDRKHNYLRHAMLIDLLPAGFELENQNLEHSFKIDDIKLDGKTIKDLTKSTKVVHQEFWDDRFMAALELRSYRSAHVFYMVRAVTPGTYTVPSSFVEDMYRPEIRGISEPEEAITISKPTTD
ncbi:alpha-2-macroglobulin family protein [Kangiella shandongensis]|uniref:alpha-2-macroglobulin family protein n=1 Tax=Kangiella shandongensis TaxID=2763258 RepID=UPI001CC09E5D|nr:alpha-2-macroglobulin [Kangiella shandongensis]